MLAKMTPTAFMSHARHLLKGRRLRMGLSQVQLAGQIGTPAQLLGEWERGEVTPSLGSLIAWCVALDCELCLLPVYARAEDVFPVFKPEKIYKVAA